MVEKENKKGGYLIHMVRHSQSCFMCIVDFDIKCTFTDKHGPLKSTLFYFKLLKAFRPTIGLTFILSLKIHYPQK